MLWFIYRYWLSYPVSLSLTTLLGGTLWKNRVKTLIMGNLILDRVASNRQNHLSSRAEVMESSQIPLRVGMTQCTWYKVFFQMTRKPLLFVSSHGNIKILLWSLHKLLLKTYFSLWLIYQRPVLRPNLKQSMPDSSLYICVIKTATPKLYELFTSIINSVPFSFFFW